MKLLWVYIRLYLMFLARTVCLTVGVELTYFLIKLGYSLIKNFYSDKGIDLPPPEYINLIAFGVAVLLALQTTYIIDGKNGKVYSNTFGFDPNK